MGNFLYIISGAVFGIYMAQNYNLPDVGYLVKELLEYLESIKK